MPILILLFSSSFPPLFLFLFNFFYFQLILRQQILMLNQRPNSKSLRKRFFLKILFRFKNIQINIMIQTNSFRIHFLLLHNPAYNMNILTMLIIFYNRQRIILFIIRLYIKIIFQLLLAQVLYTCIIWINYKQFWFDMVGRDGLVLIECLLILCWVVSDSVFCVGDLVFGD